MFDFKGINHNFGECRRMRPEKKKRGDGLKFAVVSLPFIDYCFLSFYAKGYPNLEARFLPVR